MGLPLVAGLGLGAKLLGGIFGGASKNKQAKAQHEAQRGEFERSAAARAAKAQFLRSILKGFGIENIMDPTLLDKMGTPLKFPKYVGPGLLGTLGSGLSTVGSAMLSGPSSNKPLSGGYWEDQDLNAQANAGFR